MKQCRRAVWQRKSPSTLFQFFQCSPGGSTILGGDKW